MACVERAGLHPGEGPCESVGGTERWRGTLVCAGLIAFTGGIPRMGLALELGAQAEAVQAMLLGRYSLACALEGGESVERCFSPELTLPDSSAELAPVWRPTVTIKKNQILADGVPVTALELARDEDQRPLLVVPDEQKRGFLITPLYDRLFEKAEGDKALAEVHETLAVLTQRDDHGFQGELLVSVDRDVPFSIVREVLYTAGQAQYGSFLFVTRNPWEDALKTIESSLPAIGPPRDGYEERPPLLLSLTISDEGLGVLGADAVLYPDGQPDSGADEPIPTVACKSGGRCTGLDDYDWQELNRLLARIKDEFPDDLRIILVPEPGIPFEVIVRALDHARWGPHLPLDAELGAWQHWKSLRRELFPLSTLAGGAR